MHWAISEQTLGHRVHGEWKKQSSGCGESRVGSHHGFLGDWVVPASSMHDKEKPSIYRSYCVFFAVSLLWFTLAGRALVNLISFRGVLEADFWLFTSLLKELLCSMKYFDFGRDC